MNSPGILQVIRRAAVASFFATFFTALPCFAFFGGGSGGSVRGGETAVWMGDRWELKDVLIYAKPGEPSMRLAPPIRHAILEGAKAVFETYSSLLDSQYWDVVLGDDADFRLVDNLREVCLPDGKPLDPDEANVGCTVAGTTYLDRTVFAAMDNLSRVLLVLHERGHAFDPSEDAHERWIRKFVAGLEVALRTTYEQETGFYRILDGWEVQALERLVSDPELLKALSAGSRRAPTAGVRTVVARGGGMIVTDRRLHSWELPIDDSSFLGMASLFEFFPEACGYDGGESGTFPKLRNGSRTLNAVLDCTTLDHSTVLRSVIDRLHPVGFPAEERSLRSNLRSTVRGLARYVRGIPNPIVDSLMTDSFLGTSESISVRGSHLNHVSFSSRSESAGQITGSELSYVIVEHPVSRVAVGVMPVNMGGAKIFGVVSVKIVDKKWNDPHLRIGDVYALPAGSAHLSDIALN